MLSWPGHGNLMMLMVLIDCEALIVFMCAGKNDESVKGPSSE